MSFRSSRKKLKDARALGEQLKGMKRVAVDFISTPEKDRWNLPFELLKGMHLQIPVKQIEPDPHQPRTDFDSEFAKAELEDLALSIRDQSQQQAIMVNFKERDGAGGNRFVIDKGERRWHAHQINRMEYINCIVQQNQYDAKTFSLRRLLAQFAENFQRKEQTNKETIDVLRKVYDERVKETGVIHGAMEYAVKRVASALGKKEGWMRQFAMLIRLKDEFINMLDPKKVTEPAPLTFHVAIPLSSIPEEDQVSEYEKSLVILKEKGYQAQKMFLSGRAREIKTSKGIKLKGRKHDEKRSIQRTAKQIRQLTERYAEEPDSSNPERTAKLLLTMGATEIDPLLNDIWIGVRGLQKLEGLVKARRDYLYRGLSVNQPPEPPEANKKEKNVLATVPPPRKPEPVVDAKPSPSKTVVVTPPTPVTPPDVDRPKGDSEKSAKEWAVEKLKGNGATQPKKHVSTFVPEPPPPKVIVTSPPAPVPPPTQAPKKVVAKPNGVAKAGISATEEQAPEDPKAKRLLPDDFPTSWRRGDAPDLRDRQQEAERILPAGTRRIIGHRY